MSSATSRLRSLHSQWSCGAKMLRIIISMASAICTDKTHKSHDKKCLHWCIDTLEWLDTHPGETSEDGELPLESPKTYGLYSIFHHKCVWNNEPYGNISVPLILPWSLSTKGDTFECVSGEYFVCRISSDLVCFLLIYLHDFIEVLRKRKCVWETTKARLYHRLDLQTLEELELHLQVEQTPDQ